MDTTRGIKNLMTMLLSALMGVAMAVAVNSVSSTCLILAYQPELPDELK